MAKSHQRHRNLDGQENLNAKKQDYRLGRTLSTANRFSTLSEENTEEEAKQSTEPNFTSGVKNIKPLIELLNEIAKRKYLVKYLYNEQVRVQPTESSIYVY